jgi:hypothetical protein
MKISFVLMRVCGRSDEGIFATLWAYHDVTGIVREVAVFRSMPYRNIVDSCTIVYERGVRAGMDLISPDEGKDAEIEIEVFLDEETAGEFILGRIEEMKRDGDKKEQESSEHVQEDEEGL